MSDAEARSPVGLDSIDFFITYSLADERGVAWIVWQPKAIGHRTVIRVRTLPQAQTPSTPWTAACGGPPWP